MGRSGLLVGQVATRSGLSRKALRLYEAAGILPPPHRTAAGYRVYDEGALALLDFVAQARRPGFTLAEINEIVAIRRAGGVPCSHVRSLVGRKIAEVVGDEVRIGEAGNLTVLKKEEWNVLVDLVQSGRLGRLE